MPTQNDGSQVTEETMELIRAISAWKERTGRTFPTWSELIQILKSIDRWKEKP